MLQQCFLRLELSSGILELSFLILQGIDKNTKKISLTVVFSSLKTVTNTQEQKDKKYFEIEVQDGSKESAVTLKFF